MTTAVYPGTFDPLTRGHEDIVRRAAALFERVVVGIADSASKRPLFDIDERIALARAALADLPQVSVVRSAGLTVEFARAHGARAIVRGVRSVVDFDYEAQLAGMNRQLAPEVDTVFLAPSAEWQHVSGTLVREIALLGGDVSRFASPTVAQALARKRAERAAAGG